jgi:hypothetical protein
MRYLMLVIAAVALAIAGPALAAKGGNGNPGGGKPGGGESDAYVNASPNPAAPNGTRVDLTGCGYDFKVTELRIEHSAGYTETYINGVWADGCMNPTYLVTREAGTYTIDVYQAEGNRRHPTPVLKASTTLVVG